MQQPHQDRTFLWLAQKALGRSLGLGVLMLGGMVAFTYGMSQGLDNRRRSKHMAGIGGALNLQEYFETEKQQVQAKNLEISEMMKNRESKPGQHLYENLRAPRSGEPQTEAEYREYINNLEAKKE